MTHSHLEELERTVQEQFKLLCAEFPKLKPRGLTLFLGRHYAQPSAEVLMLGLNPGLSEELSEDYKLQRENWLLGDPTDEKAKKIRYWRNARKCLGATPDLRGKMEFATLSFCCPFRTPNWSVSAKLRQALERHSKPILQVMFRHCRPRFVIVAGKTAASLCARLSPVNLDREVVSEGGYGRHHWRRRVGTAPWGSVSLIQLPHFSRFNSERGLQECGLWLAGLLA